MAYDPLQDPATYGGDSGGGDSGGLSVDRITGNIFDTSTGDIVGTTGPGINVGGNSGRNDPNSVWGSGLVTDISALGNTSANIFRAINGQPQPTKKASSSTPSWLPLALIGGLLLVAMIVLGRR